MKPTARQKPERVGSGAHLNRTGIMASPLDATAQAGATQGMEVLEQNGLALLRVRAAYEADADPIGTVPPPLPMTALGEPRQKDMALPVFIDKIGERLAFERSGVRLYQSLVGKFDARGGFPGGPEREQLVRFQQAELRHFQMLSSAITMLGGDPTAMTPSADVAAVSSVGLVQVLSDPRTTFPQALQTILIAELVDNDCWELLIEMTRAAGEKDLAEAFLEAKEEEDEHLDSVRDWLSAYGEQVLRAKGPKRKQTSVDA